MVYPFFFDHARKRDSIVLVVVVVVVVWKGYLDIIGKEIPAKDFFRLKGFFFVI